MTRTTHPRIACLSPLRCDTLALHHNRHTDWTPTVAHTYDDQHLAYTEYKTAHDDAETTAGTIARLVVKYDALPSPELRATYLAQLDKETAAWQRYVAIVHEGEEVSA